MEKNQEKIGIVSDVGNNGEGIIKDEGVVVFVPFCITGEKVKYKILKVTSKCAYGKIVEIIEQSKDRIEPRCPVFYKCGGCAFQHVNFLKQLEIKRNSIKTCFNKVANINVNVNDVVVGDSEWRYRNKLQLPVGIDKNGDTAIGFYAENSHRIVPVNDCLINAEWTGKIINLFKKYIAENNLSGYNEISGKGDIREVTVKEIDGALIITVVSLKRNLRGIDGLIELLKREIDDRFSLYVNYNDKSTNVIYGEEFRLFYGDKDYTSSMLGITYKIGVTSFMQVNRCVCEKLYKAVLDNANIDEDTTVIDAYSGAGLMTALLAKNAKKAIGIEIVGEAVRCANDLSKLNGLQDKITNYEGKCEDILPDIVKKEKGKITLVLDPPRKGCDIKVIEAVIKARPDRIIYVSCMPSTLARDVGLIVGSLEQKDGQIVKSNSENFRYKIESITPFDMFSETKHIESLCVLKKVI